VTLIGSSYFFALAGGAAVYFKWLVTGHRMEVCDDKKLLGSFMEKVEGTMP
jgi:hypothetical protein